MSDTIEQVVKKIGQYKYIVVGSGFFGATIAERIATQKNQKVLLVEKRSHIGGNSYSEQDPETGIEYHVYGSHIFHTESQEVWDYLNLFTSFNHYRHKVLTEYQGQVYSMPINLRTINQFFNKELKPFEVIAFLREEVTKEGMLSPDSFEEKAILQVGRKLYQAFIEGYTKKQWQTDLKKLPASLLSRIPLKTSYNDDYFCDRYQGIPLDGYGALFARMLDHKNIDIYKNIDYFSLKEAVSNDSLVIYTGPVDRYFNYKYGQLAWRTLRFEREVYAASDYQGTSVMNSADFDVPYTRTHEFKHFHPERSFDQKTLIFREYSQQATGDAEPYYPVNTAEDKSKLELYQQEAEKLPNVIFGGRLGTYSYLNMDEVIKDALLVYKNQIADR